MNALGSVLHYAWLQQLVLKYVLYLTFREGVISTGKIDFQKLEPCLYWIINSTKTFTALTRNKIYHKIMSL